MDCRGIVDEMIIPRDGRESRDRGCGPLLGLNGVGLAKAFLNSPETLEEAHRFHQWRRLRRPVKVRAMFTSSRPKGLYHTGVGANRSKNVLLGGTVQSQILPKALGETL